MMLVEQGRVPKKKLKGGLSMKGLPVLLVLMMLATVFANAASAVVPKPIGDFFDVIVSIVVEKGILLGGIIILVVAGIVSFVNKSWAPMAYAIVGLIIMVLALPFVTSMIGWSANTTL